MDSSHPSPIPRNYSASYGVGSINFQYVYDSGLKSNGNEQIVSGGWRPTNPNDLAGLNTLKSKSYSTNFLIATSGNYTIPTGCFSWSFAVESGAAYLNGIGPINVGFSMNSDILGPSFCLNAPLIVGITGGKAYIAYQN